MLAGREHGFSMGNTRQRNCPSWQPPARKPSLARSSAHNWSQAHPCLQCASPAGFLRPVAGPAAEQAERAEHAAAAPAWHDPAMTRHPALAAASWPGRGGTPPAAAALPAGCARRPRRLQAGLRRPMPAGPAGPAGRGTGPAAPRLQDGGEPVGGLLSGNTLRQRMPTGTRTALLQSSGLEQCCKAHAFLCPHPMPSAGSYSPCRLTCAGQPRPQCCQPSLRRQAPGGGRVQRSTQSVRRHHRPAQHRKHRGAQHCPEQRQPL